MRFCHSVRSARIACTRRSASSASRASACASARTWAAIRRWPSMSLRTAARRVSVSSLDGNSASAASALSCAASASARSAARRLWASVSADLRAAWRLISRSVVGMALARGVGLALGGAPGFAAAASALDAAFFSSASAFSSACRLIGGVDAGLLQLVLDVDEAGALGETPRRAGRGVGRGDKAVPAPDVAFERDQPLAGLELRDQFGAALARRPRRSAPGGAPVRPAPERGPRAPRRPRAAPDRRRSTPALVQRIGADGSTGASRSSPSAAPIAFS